MTEENSRRDSPVLMDTKSKLESSDTDAPFECERFIKQESPSGDPLSTCSSETADFPARSLKNEDGHSYCDGVDSPALHPTDSFEQRFYFHTPAKTEVYEEEEKWEALLHTSVDIKHEQPFQSVEFDNSFERIDKLGEECRVLSSSHEFEKDTLNASCGPLIRKKPDENRANDNSVKILNVNSETESQETWQINENTQLSQGTDIESDCGHGTRDPWANVRVTSSLDAHGNIPDKSFHSSQCPVSFAQMSALNDQMRLRTGEKPFSCSHCSASFKDHMRTQKGKELFGCSDCYASFDRRSTSARDMRTHTGEKPFSCNQCAASFGHRSNLANHMRTHTGEKPFRCSHCSACFTRKCRLTHHMRFHTGERPFAYNNFSATIRHRSTLANPMGTHSGEKLFICSHCTASFGRRETLTDHMRTHTGEKPFNCSHCAASFSRKSSLARHMPTHTGEKPYSCSNCSASFAQKSYLTKHMRTHTDEKPYICRNCSASFAQKSHLNGHMRTHTGERPYSCSNCSASFAKKSNLTSHMRTHIR